MVQTEKTTAFEDCVPYQFPSYRESYLLNDAEDILYSKWNDSRRFLITMHGVSLATAGNTIGKYCTCSSAKASLCKQIP
jgi:hypothetical protein